MELKIYDETKVVEEKPIFLRLLSGGEGKIKVCACGANGEVLFCGALITISEKGMQRHDAVNGDIGIKTEDNKIRLVC